MNPKVFDSFVQRPGRAPGHFRNYPLSDLLLPPPWMRFCASFSLDSADYITERFFMKCGGCVFCAPVEWPVPSRAVGRPVQRPGRAPGQNARWAESQLKPNYFTSETTSRAIYYSPPQGPLYIKKIILPCIPMFGRRF